MPRDKNPDRVEIERDMPRSARTDSGDVQHHSLPDQIAADKYIRGNRALRKRRSGGLGIRYVKLIPPGCVDADMRRDR